MRSTARTHVRRRVSAKTCPQDFPCLLYRKQKCLLAMAFLRCDSIARLARMCGGASAQRLARKTFRAYYTASKNACLQWHFCDVIQLHGSHACAAARQRKGLPARLSVLIITHFALFFNTPKKTGGKHFLPPVLLYFGPCSLTKTYQFLSLFLQYDICNQANAAPQLSRCEFCISEAHCCLW